MENPFTEPPADCMGYNLIDHPDARPICDLFNASYGFMIEVLMRFFAHTEESHEELRTLVDTAIGTMFGVIGPLGSVLTTLPASTNGDGRRAGPSFAFYRSIHYLPHRDAAWVLFDERVGELARFSEQLATRDKPGLGLDKIHANIDALSAGLKQHIRAPRPATGVPSS